MQTFDFRVAIGIFIAYLLIDALNAKYTLELTKLNAARTASIGVIIHLLLAFGVIQYTQNWLYVIPLVVGSWVGTYLMIKREDRKKSHSKP